MSHYNDYKLFRWNENNILYTNNNSHYNDVYLHTGTITKGEWQNGVCLTYDNNICKIISHSNHFIHHCDYGDFYNHLYKIYDNIVKNYNMTYNVTKSQNIEYDFNPDETYFYMLNAFNFSNSGHDLSISIDFVNYIIKNNIKNILIYKNYKNTNNFKLLQLLIPIDINFIELNDNQIYRIKNIIIIYPEFFNIFLHRDLIDNMITIIKNKYELQYKHLHNHNIILMKTNRNKSVMATGTQWHCEEMLVYLENHNFISLIPEEMDIFELCIYLLFANKIVFSIGSIVYTNKIFMNPNAKLLYFGYNYSADPNHCAYGVHNYTCNDASGLSDVKKLHGIRQNNYILTSDECIHFAKQIIEILEY
jgi:hypothetical protein